MLFTSVHTSLVKGIRHERRGAGLPHRGTSAALRNDYTVSLDELKEIVDNLRANYFAFKNT